MFAVLQVVDDKAVAVGFSGNSGLHDYIRFHLASNPPTVADYSVIISVMTLGDAVGT